MQVYEDESGPPDWWTGGPEEETAGREAGRASDARRSVRGRAGERGRRGGAAASTADDEAYGRSRGARHRGAGAADSADGGTEPEPFGAADRAGLPQKPAVAVGGPLDPAAVGLVRAAELPGGRRRRRSALADDSAAQRPAGDGPGDFEPEGVRAGAGRERRRGSGRRSAATGSFEEPGGGAPGGRRRRAEDEVDPEVRARDICLRLLTGAAKTRKQLADALRKREIPAEVIAQVLDRYEEVGLIDDAAFAQAWVEQRHAVRGLGRRALAQELRTRGVHGELVEQAVAQVEPEDEEEAARTLVERKLRSTRGLDGQVRTRRLVGMLARRGYSEGLAFRVVRAALEAEGEELPDW